MDNTLAIIDLRLLDQNQSECRSDPPRLGLGQQLGSFLKDPLPDVSVLLTGRRGGGSQPCLNGDQLGELLLATASDRQMLDERPHGEGRHKHAQGIVRGRPLGTRQAVE